MINTIENKFLPAHALTDLPPLDNKSWKGLMIIPNQVLAFIETSFVYRTIKGIYLTLYDHNGKSGLLDLTLDGLPSTIRLI